MNAMREVTITPCLNGFIVKVGCQTLVFNRIEDVAENLIAYQKKPVETEKAFLSNPVNDMSTTSPWMINPNGSMVFNYQGRLITNPTPNDTEPDISPTISTNS